MRSPSSEISSTRKGLSATPAAFSKMVSSDCLGVDVPGVPALAKVRAVVERDAVQPGADVGVAAETVQVPIRLEEHVVGSVLRLGLVAEEPECEVKDLAAVGLVDGGEFRMHLCECRCGGRGRGFGGGFHSKLEGLHSDWTGTRGGCHGLYNGFAVRLELPGEFMALPCGCGGYEFPIPIGFVPTLVLKEDSARPDPWRVPR